MKMIELLLTDNVDNLGIVGDVVRVRPGYARNYLLPHGLATKPTAENVELLAAKRREMEAELARKREALQKSFAKLEGFELTVERSCNDQGILYGGVSQHDIAELLRAAGFEVEDRMVRLGDQIKRIDSYVVPLQLTGELKTEIKVWVVSDQPMVETDEVADDEGEDDDA